MCALDVRPAIGTERLILRAPQRADAPVIAELANDPNFPERGRIELRAGGGK